MNGFALLAAGVGDWIFPLIVILFMILSYLGQRLGKQAQQAGRGQAQRPGGARPNAPPPPDPLQKEIGEFLRRSGHGPAPGRPQGRRPPGQPRPSPRTPQPADEGPVEVELLEPSPEGAGVAEHVRQRLPSEKFGTLPSDVGQRLAHVDDQVEEHLHKVFDHGLGTLGGTPGESAELTQAEEPESPEDRIVSVPITAAVGLAAMFASPGNLRQAVVLNEILQRPEHRWE